MLNVTGFFYCVLWHLSVASGSPDYLNPLLFCFVEFWKRWPECVSAVRLRVAVEHLHMGLMVDVEEKIVLCFEIATEWQNVSINDYIVLFYLL